MVVLLGGLPLLWETVQQFLNREFSVDLIDLLAITGSLLLREYLAGAFVVLRQNQDVKAPSGRI